MKNKIPSEGLRLGRDSGSILCDTLKKWRFRTGWGGNWLKIVFIHNCSSSIVVLLGHSARGFSLGFSLSVRP